MINITRKHTEESFLDYFVRLFENKDLYRLDCNSIADLLNIYAEFPKGESAWRKEYASFNRGRMYEQTKSEEHVALRILSISDLHVPFQKPISTFADYAGMVDVLQINGDVCDCQAISKFPKAYRVSPMEEIIEARQYLIDLIEMLQPKEVVINYGNHDLRFQNYFAKCLENDLVELMPKTSLELILVDGFHHRNKREKTKVFYSPLQEVFNETSIKITYVDDWYCQIGGTIFCHPLAFKSGMMATAEKAMTFFRNNLTQFTSLVMAHTHKLGDYTVGKTLLFEEGCCCNTKENNYSDGKLSTPQIEGFLYICQDNDGNVIRDKTKLIAI